jgi:hypothetical protein
MIQFEMSCSSASGGLRFPEGLRLAFEQDLRVLKPVYLLIFLPSFIKKNPDNLLVRFAEQNQEFR